MTLRAVRPFGIFLVLLSVCVLLAQERPEASEQRPARRALAARVAKLEDEVARLSKAVANLQARLAGPDQRGEQAAEELPEVKIFRLENSNAPELAQTIMELFLAGRRDDSPRITSDSRTNSIIVVGRPEQLEMIEALLLRLDESKEMPPALEEKPF